MTMIRSVGFYPYGSHEPKIMEYYGIVNANGSVNQGCTGLTVAKTGTGVYTLTLQDTVPITAADLTNTSMTNAANGTGVTKTAACLVNPISPTLTSTPALFYATASEPVVNGAGFLVFTINTTTAPNTGGVEALADGMFTFKIMVTTVDRGRQ